MKTKRVRDSRFEILRIIAMLLIVLHHMALYSGMLESQMFHVKAVGEFIIIGWKIGCFLFVVLSGYFAVDTVRSSFNQIIKTWTAAVFYNIALVLLFKYIGTSISAKSIIKGLFPISGGAYWFLTAYIGMLLFSPCIVCIIDKLSDAQLKEFGVLAAIAIIFVPTLLVVINPFSNTVMLFCFYYAIGVYIRKTAIEKRIKHPILKASCNILIIYIIQITLSFFKTPYTIVYRNRNWLSGNDSAMVLSVTIYIFIAFLQAEKFHNRIINFFSASAFGVYLIHDNSLVRDWLWSKCISLHCIETYTKSFLIMQLFAIAIIIYISCALIDKIRMFIFQIISGVRKCIQQKICNPTGGNPVK